MTDLRLPISGANKGEQPHVHFKDGCALNKDGKLVRIDKNPSPTKEQVIEFRDQTEQKVWGNMSDSPLQ